MEAGLRTAAVRYASVSAGFWGYPALNACWQLDATDYVLTGGRAGIAASRLAGRTAHERCLAQNH
jgi:hypothetical protein